MMSFFPLSLCTGGMKVITDVKILQPRGTAKPLYHACLFLQMQLLIYVPLSWGASPCLQCLKVDGIYKAIIESITVNW